MSISTRLMRVLEKTEARFRKNDAERTEKERLVEAGRMFEANPRELVERRLARLDADPKLASQTLTRGSIGRGTSGARPSDAAVLERVLGTNDLIGVRFLELGSRAARAVTRVHIRSSRGSVIGYGTGFMVSPRLMLTNNHVLTDKFEAANSLAEFSFEAGSDGAMKSSLLIKLAPEVFFLTDPALDYTLVAVNSEPTVGEHGWLRLIEEQGKVMVGEWVNIIQHPNGEPKQLALRENRLVDELEQFLHYVTDTAPGSSGSPVFNDQWEVVALHHSGVPKRDAQGRILAVDDRVWADWMGEHRIAWMANEGARISRIVAHIKAQSMNSDAKLMRNQVFEAEFPESGIITPLLPDIYGSGYENPVAPPAMNPDGSVSWIIPITVTLNVGGRARVSPPIAPAGTVVSAPPPATASVSVEGGDLEEALAELARGRTRTYYDGVRDASEADHYYRSFAPGKVGQGLFKDISRLVEETHTRSFSYKPIAYVYPWVDLHPDLKLRSIYSGKAVDPEDFIQEDVRVAHERAARTRELMLREANLSVERLEEEIDSFEVSLPYNCEHVVPQSWFHKMEPMRGDLHHLFACESGCNSFRSNIPYYDFPDLEEAVRDSCGKRIGDDRFEPANGKGAVARATLYFLLRYPGQIGNSSRELQRNRLDVLLNWHKTFPPDEYERHRNMAIFEMQGNRNPMIDHPEWADMIDFTLGFGGASD